jgi:hypothetical protein
MHIINLNPSAEKANQRNAENSNSLTEITSNITPLNITAAVNEPSQTKKWKPQKYSKRRAGNWKLTSLLRERRY